MAKKTLPVAKAKYIEKVSEAQSRNDYAKGMADFLQVPVAQVQSSLPVQHYNSFDVKEAANDWEKGLLLTFTGSARKA